MKKMSFAVPALISILLLASYCASALIPECDPLSFKVKIQVGDKAPDVSFTAASPAGPFSYVVGNNSDPIYPIVYNPVGGAWVKQITPLVGASTGPDNKNTHTISFNTAALAAGNYSAMIYVYDPNSPIDEFTLKPSHYTIIIINLKVGVPKYSIGLGKLPLILGKYWGTHPTFEHYMAYRGDHLPGSTTLAWDPVPYDFPVTNKGGGNMRVYVTNISNDTPVEKYVRQGTGGTMIYATNPSVDSTPGTGSESFIIIGAGETKNVRVYFYDPLLGPGTSGWFPQCGTYTGWLTLAAFDDDDLTPALIDNEIDYTVKCVMRVGPKAYVNTWSFPRTGAYEVGAGPCLVPVAGFGRADQEPTDTFTVAYDASNIDNRRTVQGLFPPQFGGYGDIIVNDPNQNANWLQYSISRGGDLGGNWIKAEINGAGGLQSSTLSDLGATDWITVYYDTSDLPVYPPDSPSQPGIKTYTGYIYVRTNDYFGDEGANYAEDQNDKNTLEPNPFGGPPHPAIAPPTYYPDTLTISTVVPVYMSVRGPTVSTDYNSFSQTIVQGANANNQTFKIWNLYGMSTLHYSVNVEGAVLPDGTKWLMVGDSDPNQDSKDETDKNTVTLTYNASGLKTGTYTAKITYVDQNATNSPYDVNIVLRVLGPVIASDKTDLNPVCVIGENAINDTQFYVWNADEKDNPPGYQGSTLQYSILTEVEGGTTNWFTCDPVKGESTGPSDKDLIKVSYLTSSLTYGQYYGKIYITNANDGSYKQINVNLNVRAPMIAISQNTFSQKCNIGTDAGNQSFQIWNSGDVNTILEYSLASSVGWLTLIDSNPQHVSTSDQDRNTITLIYSTSTLAAGVYEGKITITAQKAPNSPVEIPVTLEVQAPGIALSKTILYPTCLEGFDAAPTSYEVWNAGFAVLNYTITDNADWVSCAPTSGDSTGVNDKDQIAITYDTKDLEAGTYSGTITVADPKASNNPQIIEINLVVQKPQIAVNKNEIEAVCDIGGNPSPQSFQVWNAGTGNINFTISEVPATAWFSCSPLAGSSTGQQKEITVTFSANALPGGIYESDIQVDAIDDQGRVVVGSPQTIHVVLSVGSRVGTSVSEINVSCDEGTDAESQTFNIKNIGVGTLNYTIADNVAWLACDPTFGSSTGQNNTITVSFSTAALPAGSYLGTITITNTATGATTPIPVNLSVRSGAIISFDPAELTPSCAQGSNADNGTFEVWNSGTGTLTYTIAAGDYEPAGNWIASIVPNSGTSTGEHDTITVVYSTSALVVGSYTAKITITDPAAENSPQQIPVTLTVLGPTIGYSPASISTSCPAGTDAPATSFDVWNMGGGSLNYDISKDVAWLTCAPTSGTSTGEHDTIAVTFSTASLEAGTHNGNITITSAGATNTPVTIPVTVLVGQPEITLSTNVLAPAALQGSDADPQTFQVWNSGNGTLNFTIADDVDWLACDPENGTSTDSGDKKTITVNYTTGALEVGTYEAAITISDPSASNTPQTIAVTLTISKEVPEQNLVIHIASDEEGITKDAAGKVSYVPDQTANYNDASQRNSGKQPILLDMAMNEKPALVFNGSSSLDFISAIDINKGGPFTAKTITIVFKTGDDISTRQVIFAQGSKAKGLNMYLDSSLLYFSAWNTSSDGPGSPWGPKYVSTQLLPNTGYCATLLFDYANNYIEGFLNGTSVGQSTGIGKIYNDNQGLVLGSSTPQTYFFDNKTSGGKGFTGYIVELAYYASVLDDATRKDLEDNLMGKWGVTDPAFNPDGLVLWLRGDSQVDMDATNLVKQWGNISTITPKGINLRQSSAKKKPLFVESIVSDQPGIRFDGISKYLACPNNKDINSNKAGYTEKTVFAIFMTGADINSSQVIWTEGDNKAGMNIFIQNSSAYIGAWGVKAPRGENAWGPVFLSRNVQANTLYCVEFRLDQPNTLFQGYLNGISMGTSAAIGKIFKHSSGFLGASGATTNLNGSWVRKGSYLGGDVLEVLMFNKALDAIVKAEIEAYVNSRYGLVFPD